MTDFAHSTVPKRPNLHYLKRVAKDLLRDALAGDPTAVNRLSGNASPKLADAHRAIANEHGHRSWAELKHTIQEGNGVVAARRANRHAMPSTNTAAGFMASAKATGWEPSRLSKIIVFVFQSGLARTLDQDPGFDEEPSLAPGNSRFFISNDREPAIAVSCLSPGATAMVNQMENQVALGGADTFIAYNLAGGIGPDIEPGTLSVVATAVRDDGISDHYLAPADTVDADPLLVERAHQGLASQFPSCEIRSTWTNPAVYRQTAEELQHYADSGVSLVESEAASLLAAAQSLGVSATAVLVTASVWNNGASQSAENPSLVATTHKQGFATLLDTLAPRRLSERTDPTTAQTEDEDA